MNSTFVEYIPNDAAVLLRTVPFKIQDCSSTDPDRVVTVIGNANPAEKYVQ